ALCRLLLVQATLALIKREPHRRMQGRVVRAGGAQDVCEHERHVARLLPDRLRVLAHQRFAEFAHFLHELAVRRRHVHRLAETVLVPKRDLYLEVCHPLLPSHSLALMLSSLPTSEKTSAPSDMARSMLAAKLSSVF